MVSDPRTKTAAPAHTVAAVVLSVRDRRCRCCSGSVRSTRSRASGRCPAASSPPARRSSSRSAAIWRPRSTCASSPTSSSSRHCSDPARNPLRWELVTAYLGLVPTDVDPALPADTRWHPVDALPALAFDHAPIVLAGRERLRAKLSYTNIGFALAPSTFSISELRGLYRAALGHDVSATNLQRVLLRRHLLVPTGNRRGPGPSGGRPAALFRFATPRLEVTDPFAVLRPPSRRRGRLRTQLADGFQAPGSASAAR